MLVRMKSVYFLCGALLFQSCCAFVVLAQNGFRGLHVFVSPSVSSTEWDDMSRGLIDAFKKTSEAMYLATRGRSYFMDFTVIVPREWEFQSNWNGYKQQNDLESEMTIRSSLDSVSLYNEFPYVDHSRQCLANGDMMHFPSSFFSGPNKAGDVEKLMLKTWMSYRYGMFDELGYPQDSRYSAVYCEPNGVRTVTQCSNVPLVNSQETFFSIRGQSGDCECTKAGNLPNCIYMPLSGDAQSEDLYSSIMGFHHIYKIQTFCDTESGFYTHDSWMHNLQNDLCYMQPTMDVMLQHYDFQHGHNSPVDIEDTTPHVAIYQQRTKIVFLLDTNGNIEKNIGSMVKSLLSEWMADFAMFMHVGIVAVSGIYHTFAEIHPLTQITRVSMLDDIKKKIEDIQYTGEGSRSQIDEGLRYSLEMVDDIDSIIVLISDGSETEGDMLNCCQSTIKNNNINIVAIDISQYRSDNMKQLSQLANYNHGMYFFAGETPLLVHDALATAARTFSYPQPSQKIKIVSSMKSSGTFWIDESLRTVEITFHLLSQMNTEEISGIKLFNGGHEEDLGTVDLPKVIKTVNVGQDTIGQWSYAVLCDDCAVGVYVTGFSKDLNSVIDVDCQVLTTQINGANVGSRIVAKLMKGKMPIIGASVSLTLDDGMPIELSDDGDTGMDAIKNDGVYTKELQGNIEEGTTMQCIVSGNEVTFAHPGFEQWYQAFGDNVQRPLCCGSEAPPPEITLRVGSFTRIAISNYYTEP